MESSKVEIKKVDLPVETVESRMQRYEDYLTLSDNTLNTMVAEFVNELQKGLTAFRAHPNEWIPEECCFKMLDSGITNLPTGKERGVFYGLDFGGTNFRAVRVELNGDSTLEITENKRPIVSLGDTSSKALSSKDATASEMFDFFAHTLKDLMVEMGDAEPAKSDQTSNVHSRKSNPEETPAGFTFSFPCSQREINSAVLLEWTKGFETGRNTLDPVEGCDVGQLMNMAFIRNQLNVKVAAILNDTVGTLLSGAYTIDRRQHPACLIGLILGTGVNACYVEQTAKQYGYKGNVINIECGNFDCALPRINIDLEVDFAATANRGRQQLEKMLSGGYLGEIARRTFLKVLQHKAPAGAWVPFCLTSEHCSAIVEDESPDHLVACQVLTTIWNFEFPQREIAKLLQKICTLVIRRSAALAAVTIAAISKQTGYLQPAMGGLSVAVDGSLFKCVSFYRKEVRAHLERILGPNIASLVHLVLADDGSGKGAAILASAAS